MKNLLPVFLSAILFFTSVPAYAAGELPFSDINGHWAENLIHEDAERGFVAGYLDGTFRPDAHLTMAELLTMVNRMFGLTKAGDNTYTDVTGSKWYRSEADKAEYYQYWKEPALNGNSNAIRLDMLNMLDSLLQVPVTDQTAPFTDLEGLNEEELDLVNRFYAAGYLQGDGQGRSNVLGTLTRAEMLTFFKNCLGYIVRTQEDVPNIPKGGKVTIIGQNIVLDGVEIAELILSPGVYTNVTINNCKITELRILAENMGNTVTLIGSVIGQIQNTTNTRIEQKTTTQKSHHSSSSSSSTVHAEAPAIITDLTNHTVTVNAALTLDATATVSDGGTVTYQWYRADDALKTNPQAITTGAAYTIDTTTLGAFYYYCTVTNTNPAVNGTTVVSTDTAVSMVTVTVHMTGSGTLVDPFMIGSVEDLCLIGTGLSADGNTYGMDQSYELARNLDFTDPDSYEAAAAHMDSLSGWDYVDENTNAASTAGGITEGFMPIGDDTNHFTGSFDGNQRTISHLYINRTADSYIGLFGVAEGAAISNVGLVDVNVSGNSAVGGLLGTIFNSTTVSNSYTAGSVSGNSYAGGLVGHSLGSTISGSYARGDVSGSIYVGGLVGESLSSTVSNSYATGEVTGTSAFIGGLVGYNSSGSISIVNSYATGDVSGNSYVGGLAGCNSSSTTIRSSYATGDVSGNSDVGGLAGRNYNATVEDTIAFNSELSGSSNANRAIGSIIGGTLTNNYACAAMMVNGTTCAGITTDLNGADIANMTALSSEPLSSWEFDTDTNGDHAFWVLMSGTNRPVLYTDPDGDGTFIKLGSDDGM